MLFDTDYIKHRANTCSKYLNEGCCGSSCNEEDENICDDIEGTFDKIEGMSKEELSDLVGKLKDRVDELSDDEDDDDELEESVYCMLNSRDYTVNPDAERSMFESVEGDAVSLVEMLQDCKTYDQVLEVTQFIHEEALKYKTADDIKKSFNKIKKMDFSKEDDTKAAVSIIVGYIVGLASLGALASKPIAGIVCMALSNIVGQKIATRKNKLYALNKTIQATEKQGNKLKKKYAKEQDPAKKKEIKNQIDDLKKIHNTAQQMVRDINKAAVDGTLKSKKVDV